MKKLEKLLQEADKQSEAGNRRALSITLREIIPNRLAYFQESIKQNLQDGFSNALYKILLLELDNEEEESIELAELAYISLSQMLKQEVLASPEHYKRRMLLLHYFSDYFTDAVIEVFLKKYKTENLLQARSLAFECLEKMQLSDIFYLEDHYGDFIDKDEQLNHACNEIETAPDLSDEERENAVLMHRIIEAYLKAKYKN